MWAWLVLTDPDVKDGLEIHHNHLEIVAQVIILIVLDSGFCPTLVLSLETAAIRILNFNRADMLKPARIQSKSLENYIERKYYPRHRW